MGNCCGSCFGSSAHGNHLTPSQEIRRQQALEAAERRREANANRGIKHPSSVRRMRQRVEERERLEEEANRAGGQPTLRWQAG